MRTQRETYTALRLSEARVLMRTVVAVAVWQRGDTGWQIPQTLDIVGGSVEACRNGQRGVSWQETP